MEMLCELRTGISNNALFESFIVLFTSSLAGIEFWLFSILFDIFHRRFYPGSSMVLKDSGILPVFMVIGIMMILLLMYQVNIYSDLTSFALKLLLNLIVYNLLVRIPGNIRFITS
jgi:hypothetical protein